MGAWGILSDTSVSLPTGRVGPERKRQGPSPLHCHPASRWGLGGASCSRGFYHPESGLNLSCCMMGMITLDMFKLLLTESRMMGKPGPFALGRGSWFFLHILGISVGFLALQHQAPPLTWLPLASHFRPLQAATFPLSCLCHHLCFHCVSFALCLGSLMPVSHSL